MCLVVLAHDIGEYVLVMAANRDENYGRESLPLHAWADAPGVWGGRDVVAGGTWLGLSTRGRLAAVTNVRRAGATRGRLSRGALCREFLASDEPVLPYALAVVGNRSDYGAFNLLLHDGSALYYVNGTIASPVDVLGGVHAVSNAMLDDPWPKVERGKRALADALSRPRKDIVAAMFTLLDNRDGVDDASLLPDTGYGVELERELAPIFVTTPTFGTRCSTVVLWRRDGHVSLEERSFGPGGVPLGVVRKDLRVSPDATQKSDHS